MKRAPRGDSSRSRARIVAGVDPVGDRAAADARRQAHQARVVGAEDDEAVERHPLGELDERGLEAGHRAVVIEVLLVQVRDHGDRRRQAHERAVGLVGLGDEELAVAQAGVGLERVDAAADDDRRVEPALEQDRADHRGRRGLAVRAADGDAVLHAHQLGQHVGARDDRQAARDRGAQLGVVRLHRARVDDDLRALDVALVVAGEDAPARGDQAVGDLGRPQVRARHLVAHGEQHLGEAAHPRAPDPDEVDLARASVHVSPRSRRCRSRRRARPARHACPRGRRPTP